MQTFAQMAKEKGTRKSFWIPEAKYWMLDALTEIQRKVEQEKGVRMSEGEIIRFLLEEQLGAFNEKSKGSE